MSYSHRQAPVQVKNLGLALAVVFSVSVVSWFFGGGSPGGSPLMGGQVDRSKRQDLSGAMPGHTSPQPYFGKREFAPNVVVVTYKSGTSMRARDNKAESMGLFEDFTISSPYFHRYFITPRAVAMGETVDTMVNALVQDPMIRTAEPDFKVRRDQVLPNDEYFSELWGLHNTGQTGGTADDDIDAPEAWSTVGSPTPSLVAVLDDGIDLTHPDLVANLFVAPGEIPANGIDDDGNGYIDDVRGWDFSDNDNNPSPASGDYHGCHTSGTVAAVGNNGIGIVGVARSVRLMHVRMYGGANDYFTAFTSAIDYARLRGAKVISASYNIDGYPVFFSDAVQRARDADVIYVNSAGNNGQQNPPRQQLRAISNNVIFVAATDHNDNKASFSNYGSLVEIAAPGVNILSTVPGGLYDYLDGTSMATPHVAGACAVLRSYFPGDTARQILDRLIGTADPKPSLVGLVTGGRLNLNNALDTDTVAPSDPTNLQWVSYSTSSIRVRFNGSGDDGTSGQANSYDVRISSNPITGGNFALATPLNLQIPPVNAGVQINTELGGISPGTTFYVGVVAVDNLGNRSSILAGGPYFTKPTRMDNVESTSWFTPTTGAWTRAAQNPHSGAKCWTDTPFANYPNNANYILTSMSIAIPSSSTLLYYAKYELEDDYDFLSCEASFNGGAWTTVSRVTGSSGGYKLMSIPLPSAPGPVATTRNVRVRFRMTSDASVTDDGVYLDDFFFVKTETLFLDNSEGAINFTADSPWGLTTTKFASPTKSWTDSPAGNYANNANVKLTSIGEFDTSNLAGAQVNFKAYVDTEANFDYLRVSTATNGGSYTERGAWTGTLTAWNSYSVPAGPGGMTRLRFALTSDGSVVKDGAYVDDIAVVGEPFSPAP